MQQTHYAFSKTDFDLSTLIGLKHFSFTEFENNNNWETQSRSRGRSTRLPHKYFPRNVIIPTHIKLVTCSVSAELTHLTPASAMLCTIPARVTCSM